MIELENGKDISLKDMREAVIANAKKNADEKKKGDAQAKKEEDEGEEKINMDSEVDVDGTKMPIRELINKYNKMNKKNTDDEDKKKDDEDEDKKKKEDMKNALEKAQKEFEEGQKRYLDLMNASGKVEVQKIETIYDKVRRGKQCYGSGN